MRSAAQITASTWNALFLRIALSRLAASRFAWFWLLAEPIAFIVVMMWVYTMLRVRTIGGISTAIWVMVGILAFLTFRRTAAVSRIAINKNWKLFSFPQIRPVDPVLVSAGVDGLLMLLISVILLAGAGLVGLNLIPANPLAVMQALFGIWLLGLGYGLICSVAIKVVPPVGEALTFLIRPLYFLSGVIFPIALVPYPYHQWLMLNPLVHGLEAVRLGFAPYYHVPPDLSVGYLYISALVTICFGLTLHVRYATQLAREDD